MGELGFLKQGNAPCGATRQYTASRRKIANYKICVTVAYVSPQGHANIGRSLYLHRALKTAKNDLRVELRHDPHSLRRGNMPALTTFFIVLEQ